MVQPGDLVASRFLVERRAGAGGMGVVYRALDRLTGEPVALKIADARGGRFVREARVLAQLAHPALVRYVAHGATDAGEGWIAMEWLEGEDLAARLGRGPLSAGQALALGVRVAEGLAHAHARGVVHRDVKPANLFLVGGEPERVKVLDLGLARPLAASRRITATGAVLGTVGYMAPEQARGEDEVDPRADVFALGCVLFEALAGRPAFPGEHAAAVLAKVLLVEAPRLADLRPDVPASLDRLLARLLAKERAARPADGGEVARALSAIDLGESGDVAAAPPRPALSTAERRLVSVVLVDLAPPGGGADDDSGVTLRLDADDLATDAALARIVGAHGGSLAPLASGALLITGADAPSPRDGAARAASLALALGRELPAARVALATGRARSSASGILGEVIDRAAGLLAAPAARGGAVVVDEVAAALLDMRFEVRRDGGASLLVAAGVGLGAARTLLGRPTPCVGRDREISLLEAAIADAAAEAAPRAVLVVGPPGAGKSRVAHELAVRLGRGGDRALLFARAEAVGSGSALTLTRKLLRAAMGLAEADPGAVLRAAILRHLAALPSLPDLPRTGDFLCEILGVPALPGVEGPALLAARAEPRLMAEGMRRAVLAWIAAECAARPVVVLLEDAHWGDAPTMTWLGDALRAPGERPLVVIAFARPDVHDAFPDLWADAARTEVRLGPLPSRSSARLVRAVLGDGVDDATVDRLVARAGGNAFHLEELIRHLAEGGRADELPETVLAMAEARLAQLPADDRLLLRAASVLGETFWDAAVAALLPQPVSLGELRDRLLDLARRELIEPTHADTFPGAAELRFRHGLLRDAAYATLTDADRAAGHRLAGAWLGQAGCRDELALAEHAERCGDRAAAVRHFLGAARSAQGPFALAQVVELCTRGLEAGAAGDERRELLLLRGYASGWGADLPRALADLGRVMDTTAPGSEPWMHAAGGALYVGTLHGDAAPVASFARAMLTTRPTHASPTCGFAFEKATTALLLVGRFDEARALGAVAFELEARAPSPHPLFVANLHHLRAVLGAFIDDDPAAALRALAEERRICGEAGDDLLDADALHLEGMVLGELGDPRGLARLEEVFRITDVRAISAVQVTATVFLARHLIGAGRLADARALVAARRGALPPLADTLLAVEEAALAIVDGDAARARALVLPLAAPEQPLFIVRVGALAVAARAALALGLREEALQLAEVTLALGARGHIQDGSWIHLVRVEALRGLGRAAEAEAALAVACARIERIAASLPADLGEGFRRRVAPNASLLALAGGEGGGSPVPAAIRSG